MTSIKDNRNYIHERRFYQHTGNKNKTLNWETIIAKLISYTTHSFNDVLFCRKQLKYQELHGFENVEERVNLGEIHDVFQSIP